jgi:hypothetical protein
MYPEELDAALLAWRAVSNKFDPTRGVKEQLRAWLDARYPKMPKDQKNRIATVSNWQKAGGRPSSKAR